MNPIALGEARALFAVGLRNAHAMEQQSRAMLERQVERLRNYPNLEQRIRLHLQETKAQIERLDEILESLGEDRSLLKDMALSLAANVQAFMTAAAGDEILKSSFANFAFENYEIAAYESLLAMGQVAEQTAAIRILQLSLREERAMANWLADHLRELTLLHLQLRSQGGQASR